MDQLKRKPGTDAANPDRVEGVIYAIILAVIGIVPLLAFAFSFGNVGDLGVSLTVDKRIAYLTGPAVDLSVTGLIVAASWLSYRGWSERRLWPVHALSIACGLIMFALNCGRAIYEQRYGLAAFNAVGPFLLAAWGFVGPWLLRQLAAAKTAAPTVATDGAGEAVPTKRRQSRPPTVRAADETPTGAADRAPTTQTPSAPTADTSADSHANQGADSGASVIDFGTASAAVGLNTAARAAAALPVYRRYVKDNGSKPTAPQLAAALERAGLGTLGVSRARDVRAATEKLYDACPNGEDETDSEAVAR